MNFEFECWHATRTAWHPYEIARRARYEAELRGCLVELSAEVAVHPYWVTLAAEDVVPARKALKEALGR